MNLFIAILITILIAIMVTWSFVYYCSADELDDTQVIRAIIGEAGNQAYLKVDNNLLSWYNIKKGGFMPRKGQHLKGQWLNCEFCGKKYWATDSRIKKWNPRFCNEECRNKGVSSAYKFMDKIIDLYVNKEWSVNRISIYLKIGSRESIQNLLKSKKISIRERYFYTRGEKNPNYKGGYITNNGYRCISAGGGKQILEHRKIMSEYLKRQLNRNEHVHHLNGNKLDNRIENLAIYTPYKHGELHAKEYNNIKKMYCSRIAELEYKLNLFS